MVKMNSTFKLNFYVLKLSDSGVSREGEDNFNISREGI